ncbi:hypothetical protein F5B22DRAFT_305048 [Xylaria bambusicola]|uniref:uncharacterized protein n=1 Tax=Xylaria bambusicola TaxID=326684 RepID=UPI0020082306|nr:uncharacterized protein F5B22DRAFT_305048 [Xylaria bambusicola]KAI0512497.1 hypothetical protein F5B22DRAFT_305048 [Xylaria bambusicola]
MPRAIEQLPHYLFYSPAKHFTSHSFSPGTKMQLTLLAFPLFASLAAARPAVMPPVTPPPSLDWLDSKIPDCGRGCLNDGLKAVGCDTKDYQCRCDNGHQLFNISLPCIESNCTTIKENDRLNAASITICEELAWGNSSWFNRTFSLFPGLLDP